MTWVWASSMGRKQGDHAVQRAGTNISGGIRYFDWGVIAAYAYRFVEEPIRPEQWGGLPPGV